MRGVLLRELERRLQAAAEYGRLGEEARAAALRAQADLVGRYIGE